MIEEIYIKNFILIDEQSICLKKGLNIITGETGAGKSIILRGINILLGAIAKTDFIGDNGERAIIEGTFIINDSVEEILKNSGIEVDNNRIIITREISNYASTISRINGRRITVKLLKNIGEHLLDFHGQNQHQFLLDTTRHIDYLDSFGSIEIDNCLNKISILYNEYSHNKLSLNKLKKDNEMKNREMDFLEFQLDEILKVDLKENEIEKLEKEHKYLSNLEKIKSIFGKAINDFKSDGQIYDKLEDTTYDMQKIEEYDNDIKEINDEIKNLFYNSEILIEKMQEYFYNLNYDEYRLNDINSRLDEVNEIMKKYGNSYDEIISFKEKLETKIENYNEIEEKILEIENRNEKIICEYNKVSQILTNLRVKYAKKFEEKINQEFNELNMKNSNIKIDIKTEDKVRVKGKDNIEILISTNLGQPFKPLKEIVSGGELSRTMLAIKLITKNVDDIPTIIFDEVDTGISGATANIIGKKLKNISNGIQVITITHLPQIAAFSDHHIAVEKSVNEKINKTVSKMKVLNKEGKVKELAKLISGSNITDMSIKSAEELIQKSIN